jgi:hypothetical protein
MHNIVNKEKIVFDSVISCTLQPGPTHRIAKIEVEKHIFKESMGILNTTRRQRGYTVVNVGSGKLCL